MERDRGDRPAIRMPLADFLALLDEHFAVHAGW
jgi:hypothetical protein